MIPEHWRQATVGMFVLGCGTALEVANVTGASFVTVPALFMCLKVFWDE